MPAELRELLEVLADLTRAPPEGAQHGNWNRRREAEGRPPRVDAEGLTIGSLVSTLRIHDQFPGVAGKLL